MILSNEYLRVVIVNNWIMSIEYLTEDFLFPFAYIDYENRMKPRGGSHPCFPNFGPAPTNYSGLPQHGYLRNQIPKVLHTNSYKVSLYSRVGGTKSYPWEIDCMTEFRILDKTVIIKCILSRSDELEEKAPFNLGMHNYWNNPNGISNNINGLNLPDRFRDTVKRAKQIQWNETNGPVILEIADIGKVKMSMESEGKNQIVVWSDDPRFLCFEQVIDDPIRFGTKSGLHLESHDLFEAEFTLNFS